MTKATTSETTPSPIATADTTPTQSVHAEVPPAVDDNNIPLMSMIFGIVGLATFMLFLGIPALVLGIIGLRKYPTNRGFSIAGVITGALSILAMLAVVGLFVLLGAMGGFSNSTYDMYDDQYNNRYENNRQLDRSREGA